MGNGMKKVILSIDGMRCSACSSALEKYLNKQKGVKASVNLVLAQALIEYEEGISIKQIEKYIRQAGFKSLGIYNPKKEQSRGMNKFLLFLYFIVMLITMYLTMGSMFNLPKIEYLNIDTSKSSGFKPLFFSSDISLRFYKGFY